MDRIFDIVIGLVILYGLLSPLFSKKQKDDKTKPKPPLYKSRQGSESPDNSLKTRYRDYGDTDLLSEVEGIFKGQTPKSVPSTKPPIETSGSVIVEEMRDQGQSRVVKETIKDKNKAKSHTDSVVSVFKSSPGMPSIPISSKVLSPITTQRSENRQLNYIKSVFKHKKNIKNAILIATVLDKPKALKNFR